MRAKLSFSLVLLMAIVIAACGRQVTPNPPGFGAGGAAPGYMSVTFDVAGTLNFSQYQYWVVFDTTGDGQTPSTFPQNNAWLGYSGAIEVGGGLGTTSGNAYQFVRSPGVRTPALVWLGRLPPQQFQYIANGNGSQSEFTIIFQRSIFTPINQYSPNPSPSPLASVWTYNAFTTQGNINGQATFVDSMGSGGPGNPQYVSPALDTRTCFDLPSTARYSGQQLDPAAQITNIEIANNPSPAPSITPCP